MTFHLDSQGTTDIKPEMLSGVQTGYGTPHGQYNIRSIAHARTNRNDNIFMQRRLGQIFTCILEWVQRTCKKSRPYPVRAYTTLVVLVLNFLFEGINSIFQGSAGFSHTKFYLRNMLLQGPKPSKSNSCCNLHFLTLS